MAIFNEQVPNENRGDNLFISLWRKMTIPDPEIKDENRRIYMTNVILVILNLISIPFTLLSFIGILLNVIPLDTLIIFFGMSFLFLIAWLLVHRGLLWLGGIIPCLVMFATAVYGNYVGGIDAPAMLLYAMAILLAAIVFDTRTQMIFLVLSLISYFGLGLAHYYHLLPTPRSSEFMFINRVSIFLAALTTLSLGLWFLRDQYRRLLTHALAQSKNTRAIFETVTDGIVLTDLSGNIIDLNDAMVNLFQFKKKEWVRGKQALEFVDLEDRERVRDLYRSLRDRNEVGLLSCTGRDFDGKELSLEINAALFQDSEGRPSGYVTGVRDITERKKAELELIRYRDHLEELVAERTAELKGAYDELESFSYSISHDLRSPLRRIEGFSHILAEDYSNLLTEQGISYVTRIKEGTHQMGDLINDLLAFSRLIRQPVSCQLVNPGKVARDVAGELMAGDYVGLSVEIKIDEMPPCEADPSLLHQVYFNLLDNAVKYSRYQKTPRVSVGAKINEEGLPVYFVKDNGIGFEMEYADRVFGVFQRLHSNTEYEGTGIGLAIVKRIIQRHNGRIWMESEVDRGTIFYFTLENGQAKKKQG